MPRETREEFEMILTVSGERDGKIETEREGGVEEYEKDKEGVEEEKRDTKK